MQYFNFIFLLLFFKTTCYSQVLSLNSSFGDRERFVKEVKQLDQFFKRFNNKEDIFTGVEKSSEVYSNEKKDLVKFQTERKKSLITLLNFSDSALIKKKETVDFINYAGDDTNHVELGYDNEDWYARVECLCKYKGEKQNLHLILKREGTPELGNKWVITGIDMPFISLDPVRTDTVKFISPMNHEVGFMGLFKVFRDNSNIIQYTSTGFIPDELTLFLYLVKTGELQYFSVISIQYHFLQVKNWLFTVDYFNRASNNSGWLISSVVPMDDGEKMNYKKNVLNIMP
ncbi:MAG: hypothetical protein ABFD10_08030 [Prolixibacteraceae bacterium]